MSSSKTILFLGATGGCGASALRRSLDAGHACIALARTPSKLTDIYSADKYPNLTVVQGNAHDSSAVATSLVNPTDPTRLVDIVIFSIGGAFQFSKLTIDDPTVCHRGIVALLDGLAAARKKVGNPNARPRITATSTTGISRFGRDVPLGLVPLYYVMLKVPHEDKLKMEAELYTQGGRGMQERWTIVRPTLLTDGKAEGKFKVGVEDPVNGWETNAPGYTISRDGVGAWIFENIIQQQDDEKWVRKAVTLSS